VAKEHVYQNMEEVRGYFVVAGYPDSTQGISFVPLKSYEEREVSSAEAAMTAMKGFFMIPEIIAFAMPPQSLGASSSTPISAMIQTNRDYESMLKIGTELVQKMNENPGINQVRLDLNLNKPELQIDIDRQKAADLGISILEISQTLETLLGSKNVTRFKKGNTQYNVVMQMDETQRNSPQDMSDIYLRSKNGEMVALENLITIEHATTANHLPHFNKYRAAQITGGINDGYSLGEAINFIEAELAKISEEARIDYRDSTREYIESGNTMIFAMLLALLFIYLVLAAQFESFTDPFIILTSVLPAFVGALIALKLSDGSLNIYSKIGLITLVGLITKHGILMVEFANHAISQGKSKVEAIVEAANTRYRPILMTAAATVLGALPLAFAHGPGAETRHEIGWVIVGGLSLGTVLTLLIVPVVFVSLSRRKCD
jgi:multidrug efflux pump